MLCDYSSKLCCQHKKCKSCYLNNYSIVASRLSIQCSQDRHQNNLQLDKNSQAIVQMINFTQDLCTWSIVMNLCTLSTDLNSSSTENLFHYQMQRLDNCKNLIDYAMEMMLHNFNKLKSQYNFDKHCCIINIDLEMINKIQKCTSVFGQMYFKCCSN